MPTTTSRPPAVASPNAHPEGLRIEPPRGQARRSRVSWIVVGLVVVLLGAVLGAVTIARIAGREPVLALAEAVERGETLTAAHVRVVRVASEEPLPLVPASDHDELVGMTALADLPAGTLITPEQFAHGPGLAAGWTVVGLALQPGEYPTSSLAAGDRVLVVRTPDADLSRSDTGVDATSLTEEAEVFAVKLLSESTRAMMVSVAVPEEAATAIAAAAAQGRVRLILTPAR